MKQGIEAYYDDGFDVVVGDGNLKAAAVHEFEEDIDDAILSATAFQFVSVIFNDTVDLIVADGAERFDESRVKELSDAYFSHLSPVIPVRPKYDVGVIVQKYASGQGFRPGRESQVGTVGEHRTCYVEQVSDDRKLHGARRHFPSPLLLPLYVH
nr:hypothetical protein Iba_scaffold45177CG0010 [Ipomoea batatas]GMD41309.1 hypothetical protein Iba_chr10aCG17820 [Ipomoea batatas]GMD44352.1 hypothetical protein Iba_chr10cCG14100 [Ipomoea batatas]